ncbi:MAG TPA: hypothetical protein VJQ82_26190 [Terriglobales bacterium]|nr:hypothetical protein [Terriglobales bacterium]
MSTGVETLGVALNRELKETKAHQPAIARDNPGRWNSDRFAAEQIRGLVLQVFLSRLRRSCRQVVLTAVDAATDLGELCCEVGRVLATESGKKVCIVTQQSCQQGECGLGNESSKLSFEYRTAEALGGSSRRISNGLWQLPTTALWGESEVEFAADVLRRRLDQLRTEFDFSVIQAPAAGRDGTAALLGQMTDGVILVLEAHRTRRLAAQKALTRLRAADVPLLGLVLSQRTFPIPERLYSCL